MRLVILAGMLVVLLAGCVALNPRMEQENAVGSETGMMNGMMNGMMGRHHAQIPEEYAGLSNPTPADDESLARGAAIYAEQCASCHGDGGMGDGPAGEALDPQPAAIAHTSQMMGDDYLFWRISEGAGNG
jgi:mono/diheme cytochrome c family protein